MELSKLRFEDFLNFLNDYVGTFREKLEGLLY